MSEIRIRKAAPSLAAGAVAAMLGTASVADVVPAFQASVGGGPMESRIPVGGASLYAREIGRGQPVIVLHGGPDFDHGYCCRTSIGCRMPFGSSTTTSGAAESPRRTFALMT